MTTVAVTNPDIFLGMLVGTTCLQAVIEAAENGLQQQAKYKFPFFGVQGGHEAHP